MTPDSLKNIIYQQIERIAESKSLSINIEQPIITRPKSKEHGDYTCNIALRMARHFSLPPLDFARLLDLESVEGIDKVDIVAPGFINFFLSKETRQQVVKDIIISDKNYARKPPTKGSVLVEFVSSNPTGPLHTGHGRGAAYGSSLINILKACGYKVDGEYYLNDAGRQMSILAVSLWIRYLQKTGYNFSLPSICYQGNYLVEMAEEVYSKYANKYLPQNIDRLEIKVETDKELDLLIKTSKQLLGNENFLSLQEIAKSLIVKNIHDDLNDFKVSYDSWFSEKKLLDNNKLQDVIEKLKKENATYTKDGALWFRSSDYGDDKDRVILRDNGEYTYFATDIAYHANKFDRGYDRVIDVFGADHHGYIARIQAAMLVLGYGKDKIEVVSIQFANLIRNNEKISMSTRGGVFVELSQLVKETGVDAARFFYLMRRHEQHLDFDIDLATTQTKENPVYYVQYAYARVNQVMHQAKSLNMLYNQEEALNNLDKLIDSREQSLIGKLAKYQTIVEQSGEKLIPHLICQYLRELAALFHNYYASVKILDEQSQWQPKLALLLAVQLIIANGLELLGISVLQHM